MALYFGDNESVEVTVEEITAVCIFSDLPLASLSLFTTDFWNYRVFVRRQSKCRLCLFVFQSFKKRVKHIKES